MSEVELKSTSPLVFTGLIKGLNNMKHTILYYGPATAQELSSIVTKYHKTSKKLSDVPVNKPYEWTSTPTNEILIAPYDAKNIYLRMLNQNQKQWNATEMPIINLFNEYFGGGMNTIVFQELRETRGLAYNANALYTTPTKAGNPEFTRLHIISQNDKMMDCINVFKDITYNLPENRAALDIARQSLMKSIEAKRSSKFNLINEYLYYKRLGIDYDLNKVIYDKLPTLTMEDIVNFEKANIAGKPMHYIILGNENELDMQSLYKIGNVNRVSLSDIFGY